MAEPAATPSAAAAAAPLRISADGSALLQHTEEDANQTVDRSGSTSFSLSGLADPQAQRAALRRFFEVEDTARFIHARAHPTAADAAGNSTPPVRRVACQFPDEWLPFATRVLAEIAADLATMEAQRMADAATSPSSSSSPSAAIAPVSISLCILADTSYGSCCVDEVAASHTSADLVVHYGFSCMSRTRRMPVRYVFGRKEIDAEAVCAALMEETQWKEEAEQAEAEQSSFGSSSSLWGSTSSAAPAVATPAAAAPVASPPVVLLLLYSLEFAHAVRSGELPRAIQAALAARFATHAADASKCSREFIVALARVETEQLAPGGEDEVLRSGPSCASGKCGTQACCSSGAAAAAAPSCACASQACAAPSAAAASTPASGVPSAPATAPAAGVSSVAALPPLVFTSSTASGLVDPSVDPLASFTLNGFHFSLPLRVTGGVADSDSPAFQRGVQCVWLGGSGEDRMLTNCMLNYNGNAWHSVDPSAAPAPSASAAGSAAGSAGSAATRPALKLRRNLASQSRTLSRRFFLMEQAKNAEIIGIVVGTLGVAQYLSAIRALQSAIRNAGKKSYLFAVGKLNEPKLSNFSEIDCFVLVACPLNTMFDSRSYFRQVITPFELQMALSGEQWRGRYRTGFEEILPAAPTGPAAAAASGGAQAAGPVTVAVPAASDPEWLNDDLASGVRFDPVSGKMRAVLPSHQAAAGIAPTAGASSSGGNELIHVNAQGQQLTRLDSGELVVVRSAADHFSGLRFQGLQLRHEGEEAGAIAPIEAGLAGIARRYVSTDDVAAAGNAATGSTTAAATAAKEKS